MKKKLLIGFVCLLLVCGCKDVKLTDGKNAIVTFEEGGISSDELFSVLKEKYGANELVNLIDAYLLDKKYEKTTDETSYITQNVKAIKEEAKKANVSFETYIQTYYGIADESALKDALQLSYRRNEWAKDYAKEIVTEKQVTNYYETEIYGDIEASHILITIDASSDASDSDKSKAESEALNNAKKVIQELKDGKDFSELAKKYSKDAKTSSNGGSLGKVNKGDLEEEALNALRELKDGSYTTSPVKASDGYHILYRKSQDEKPELTDELTETIKTTIADETVQDSSFLSKAVKALREQNKMKIIDTALEKEIVKD